MSRTGPFRDILRLSVGDLVAKTLNFLAYVYLARLVGVVDYGSLEFARAVLLYLLLFADAGLEQWAIREAARGGDLRLLVGRVVPLRLLLALGSFGALLAILPLFPAGALLRTLTILYGLTMFSQAIGLKWVYMSQSRMVRVAGGLLAAQILFSLAVFGAVRDAQRLVWVPIFQLGADLAMAAYFARMYTRDYGSLRFPFTLGGARKSLASALPLGLSTGLALMNFNFDMILLGFLAGAGAVGLYGAAYKPISAVLAMPTTYFLGIFPALSRAFEE